MDTVAAAEKYPGSVTLVFASHKRPGGGWQNHERGQEEWIARRTDLVARLQPSLGLYGDNTKPFYILLERVKVTASGSERDFICVPAPLASKKGTAPLYPDLAAEIEARVERMCGMVAHYPVFIVGPWGCGFFGNDRATVEALFRKHARNDTVVWVEKPQTR